MTPEEQAAQDAEIDAEWKAAAGRAQQEATRMTPEQKHRFTQFKAGLDQAWNDAINAFGERKAGDNFHESPQAMAAARASGQLKEMLIRPDERGMLDRQIEFWEDDVVPYGQLFGSGFASEKSASKRKAADDANMRNAQLRQVWGADAPKTAPAGWGADGNFLRELTSRTGLPAQWWTNDKLTAAARRKMVADLKRKK